MPLSRDDGIFEDQYTAFPVIGVQSGELLSLPLFKGPSAKAHSNTTDCLTKGLLKVHERCVSHLGPIGASS